VWLSRRLRLGGERRGEEAAQHCLEERAAIQCGPYRLAVSCRRDGAAARRDESTTRRRGADQDFLSARPPLALSIGAAYPASGLDLAPTRRTTCDDWLSPWALWCC